MQYLFYLDTSDPTTMKMIELMHIAKGNHF